MRDTSSLRAQALVALIAMMTLVAVMLAVALVVTSGVGPHLAHLTQSFTSNLLANGGNPHPWCPGGAPTC
jgi:hypothetical protein